MKNLKILLSIQGKQVGTASYISLTTQLGKSITINLKDLKMISPLSLKKGSAIMVTICFKNNIYTNFEIYLKSEHDFEDSFETLFNCTSELKVYDQNVIEILYSWDNNKDLSWPNLRNDQKDAWLIACLCWSGLPKTIPKEKVIEFNSSLIKTKADCYCLLGEIFFGKRGYFGRDLDGIEDCLSSINYAASEKPILRIIDFSNLKTVLDKAFEGYTEELITIFKNHGFIVDLVSN